MKAEQTIIEPGGSAWRWPLKEWWRYRDLFLMLVRRDILIVYKQTLLGLGWAVLNPLLTMLVFSIVFGKLLGAGKNEGSYALFSLTALVPWAYFSQAVTSSANSLIGQTHIFTKIYFPRLFIPLSPITAKLLDFAIGLVLLLLILALFPSESQFNTGLLLLPLFVLIMVITAAGFGLWLSALAVRFRDIRFVTPFLIQMLLFAAPVIYPASVIPQEYRLLYGLFPMAGVIEGLRSAVLEGYGPMPFDLLLMGSIGAFILFLSGMRYFRGAERRFADLA